MKKKTTEFTTIQIRKTTRDIIEEFKVESTKKVGTYMTYDEAIIYAIKGKFDKISKNVA